MKRAHVLSSSVLAIAALAAPVARADFDFTFSSSPTITSASATPPGTNNTISNGISIGGLPGATFTSLAASGTSTITLTGRNTLGPFDATSGVDTPFLDVVITSNDLVKRLYSLTFDVAFTLTDPTPGGGPGPQVIHFTGRLTGSIDGLTPTGTALNFSVVDFSPALGTGPTVTAGDGTFRVILDSFTDAGRGPTLAGGLTARVTAVPEPASAALFGLGLGTATVVAVSRSRRVVASSSAAGGRGWLANHGLRFTRSRRGDDPPGDPAAGTVRRRALLDFHLEARDPRGLPRPTRQRGGPAARILG